MNVIDMTCSLKELVDRVQNEPKLKMVYSGIKQNSVGFVFGPSKSGKTIFCENLGMSIASGQNTFMGLPIEIDNRKVLFISFEEFYTGRTDRNIKQLSALSDEERELFYENYFVANDKMPRYLSSDEDWVMIRSIIGHRKPGIVFLDSMSRLYEGSIEDSKVGKKVMKQLRELCDEMKITLIVIHHTPKIGNSPLTVDSMAGSRMLAQESDFAIGINKVSSGKRYVKDVFFRYTAQNDEMVRVFEINKDIWLKHIKEESETKLLFAGDGRADNSKSELILDSFGDGEEIPTGLLIKKFVASELMSKQTLHNHLNKLMGEGIIKDIGHGKYMKAA